MLLVKKKVFRKTEGAQEKEREPPCSCFTKKSRKVLSAYFTYSTKTIQLFSHFNDGLAGFRTESSVVIRGVLRCMYHVHMGKIDCMFED